jgi:hypothetical protein
LLGEEDTNEPQFFSPQRVLAAKAYQQSKEAAEKEKKRQRAINKKQALSQRQKKQVEQ